MTNLLIELKIGGEALYALQHFLDLLELYNREKEVPIDDGKLLLTSPLPGELKAEVWIYIDGQYKKCFISFFKGRQVALVPCAKVHPVGNINHLLLVLGNQTFTCSGRIRGAKPIDLSDKKVEEMLSGLSRQTHPYNIDREDDTEDSNRTLVYDNDGPTLIERKSE